MTGQAGRQPDIDALLRQIERVRIGVVGDFCLDTYWDTDPSGAEVSVETGLDTRAVRSHRYTLGGAGNVAHNLVALGVKSVSVYGAIGGDPFGFQMRAQMRDLGIRTDGLLNAPAPWATHAYIKPIQAGRETNRIDFGNFNRLPDVTARELESRLAADLPVLDAVIINQQVRAGIHRSASFQSMLQMLIRSHPQPLFILDARDLNCRYEGVVRKINAYEAACLTGLTVSPGDLIGLDVCRSAALKLADAWGHPVFLSRGDRGCLVADGERIEMVPGIHIVEPTDPVGAGDSMVAGIAVALAVGCPPLEAAIFGNLVASVTVRKLHQTGTASPEEIRCAGSSPDYVYRPEKADDPRSAVYREDTEIEIVTGKLGESYRLAHAIFDHDGTISVLREGWEQIMEPMMVRSVLGSRYEQVDETVYHTVLSRVRTFIDATTGIQTLVQMQGLAKLVVEFGFVPPSEILDERGYKEIYNRALFDMVRERLRKLERGERALDDFVMKGAVEFLRTLDGAGVKLYLASGSDEDDVIAEARALGYGDLFEGRIYGAVGDAGIEAKRIVMDRILADIGLQHAPSMAAFGDGPVEVRESCRRGGLAVGVASDEVRRYGLNATKRRRLIRAGADLILPDFSQWRQLSDLLGITPERKGSVRKALR